MEERWGRAQRKEIRSNRTKMKEQRVEKELKVCFQWNEMRKDARKWRKMGKILTQAR